MYANNPTFREWLKIVLSKDINDKDDELYSFDQNKQKIKKALEIKRSYNAENELALYFKFKQSEKNGLKIDTIQAKSFLFLYLAQECINLLPDSPTNCCPILRATHDLFFNYHEKKSNFNDFKNADDKANELSKIKTYIDDNLSKIISKEISEYKGKKRTQKHIKELAENINGKIIDGVSTLKLNSGGVFIGEEAKVSKSLSKVFQLCSSVIKDEINFNSEEHFAENIKKIVGEKVKGKYLAKQPTLGFFGLGARDSKTSSLYQEIISIVK